MELDLDQVLDVLRAAIRETGTAKAWAEQQGVTPSFVSDILNKRRDPTPVILKPLGLERIVVYDWLPVSPRPERSRMPPVDSHPAAEEDPQNGPQGRTEEEGSAAGG